MKKRRKLSAKARANISLGLARVLGPTRGLDPYEAHPRDKKPGDRKAGVHNPTTGKRDVQRPGAKPVSKAKADGWGRAPETTPEQRIDAARAMVKANHLTDRMNSRKPTRKARREAAQETRQQNKNRKAQDKARNRANTQQKRAEARAELSDQVDGIKKATTDRARVAAAVTKQAAKDITADLVAQEQTRRDRKRVLRGQHTNAQIRDDQFLRAVDDLPAWKADADRIAADLAAGGHRADRAREEIAKNKRRYGSNERDFKKRRALVGRNLRDTDGTPTPNTGRAPQRTPDTDADTITRDLPEDTAGVPDPRTGKRNVQRPGKPAPGTEQPQRTERPAPEQRPQRVDNADNRPENRPENRTTPAAEGTPGVGDNGQTPMQWLMDQEIERRAAARQDADKAPETTNTDPTAPLTTNVTVTGGGRQASPDYLNPEKIRTEPKYAIDAQNLADELTTPEAVNKFNRKRANARTAAQTDTGDPARNRANVRRTLRMDALAEDLRITNGETQATRPTITPDGKRNTTDTPDLPTRDADGNWLDETGQYISPQEKARRENENGAFGKAWNDPTVTRGRAKTRDERHQEELGQDQARREQHAAATQGRQAARAGRGQRQRMTPDQQAAELNRLRGNNGNDDGNGNTPDDQPTPPRPTPNDMAALAPRRDATTGRARNTAKGRNSAAKGNRADQTTRRRADEQRATNKAAKLKADQQAEIQRIKDRKAKEQAAATTPKPEDPAARRQRIADAEKRQAEMNAADRAKREQQQAQRPAPRPEPQAPTRDEYDDLADQRADRDQFNHLDDDALAAEAEAINNRWNGDLSDFTPQGMTDEMNLEQVRADRARLADINEELATRQAEQGNYNTGTTVNNNDDEAFQSLTDADMPNGEDPTSSKGLLDDLDDDDLADLTNGPLAAQARQELARRAADRAAAAPTRAPRKNSRNLSTESDDAYSPAALAALEAEHHGDDATSRAAALQRDLTTMDDKNVQNLATHGDTMAADLANQELDRRHPFRPGGALEQRAEKFSSTTAFDNYVKKNNLTQDEAKQLADLGAAKGNSHLYNRSTYADQYDGYLEGTITDERTREAIDGIDHDNWDALKRLTDRAYGNGNGRDKRGESDRDAQAEEALTTMFDEVGYVPDLHNFIRTANGLPPEGPTSVDEITEHFTERRDRAVRNATGKRGKRLTPLERRTRDLAEGRRRADKWLETDRTDTAVKRRLDNLEAGKAGSPLKPDVQEGHTRAIRDEAMRRGIIPTDKDYRDRHTTKATEKTPDAPKEAPKPAPKRSVTNTANAATKARDEHLAARRDKNLTTIQKAQAEKKWRDAEVTHAKDLESVYRDNGQTDKADRMADQVADKQRRANAAQRRLDQARIKQAEKKQAEAQKQLDAKRAELQAADAKAKADELSHQVANQRTEQDALASANAQDAYKATMRQAGQDDLDNRTRLDNLNKALARELTAKRNTEAKAKAEQKKRKADLDRQRADIIANRDATAAATAATAAAAAKAAQAEATEQHRKNLAEINAKNTAEKTRQDTARAKAAEAKRADTRSDRLAAAQDATRTELHDASEALATISKDPNATAKAKADARLRMAVAERSNTQAVVRFLAGEGNSKDVKRRLANASEKDATAKRRQDAAVAQAAAHRNAEPHLKARDAAKTHADNRPNDTQAQVDYHTAEVRYREAIHDTLGTNPGSDMGDRDRARNALNKARADLAAAQDAHTAAQAAPDLDGTNGIRPRNTPEDDYQDAKDLVDRVTDQVKEAKNEEQRRVFADALERAEADLAEKKALAGHSNKNDYNAATKRYEAAKGDAEYFDGKAATQGRLADDATTPEEQASHRLDQAVYTRDAADRRARAAREALAQELAKADTTPEKINTLKTAITDADKATTDADAAADKAEATLDAERKKITDRGDKHITNAITAAEVKPANERYNHLTDEELADAYAAAQANSLYSDIGSERGTLQSEMKRRQRRPIEGVTTDDKGRRNLTLDDHDQATAAGIIYDRLVDSDNYGPDAGDDDITIDDGNGHTLRFGTLTDSAYSAMPTNGKDGFIIPGGDRDRDVKNIATALRRAGFPSKTALAKRRKDTAAARPQAAPKAAPSGRYAAARGKDRDALVYNNILRGDALTTREVADATGLTPAQARTTLNRLADAGLVGKSSEGGTDAPNSNISGNRVNIADNLVWADTYRDDDGHDAANHLQRYLNGNLTDADTPEADAPSIDDQIRDITRPGGKVAAERRKAARESTLGVRHAELVERMKSHPEKDIMPPSSRSLEWHQMNAERAEAELTQDERNLAQFEQDIADFKSQGATDKQLAPLEARRKGAQNGIDKARERAKAARKQASAKEAEQALSTATAGDLPTDATRSDLQDIKAAARKALKANPTDTDALAVTAKVDDALKALTRKENQERKARQKADMERRNKRRAERDAAREAERNSPENQALLQRKADAREVTDTTLKADQAGNLDLRVRSRMPNNQFDQEAEAARRLLADPEVDAVTTQAAERSLANISRFTDYRNRDISNPAVTYDATGRPFYNPTPTESIQQAANYIEALDENKGINLQGNDGEIRVRHEVGGGFTVATASGTTNADEHNLAEVLRIKGYQPAAQDKTLTARNALEYANSVVAEAETTKDPAKYRHAADVIERVVADDNGNITPQAAAEIARIRALADALDGGDNNPDGGTTNTPNPTPPPVSPTVGNTPNTPKNLALDGTNGLRAGTTPEAKPKTRTAPPTADEAKAAEELERLVRKSRWETTAEDKAQIAELEGELLAAGYHRTRYGNVEHPETTRAIADYDAAVERIAADHKGKFPKKLTPEEAEAVSEPLERAARYEPHNAVTHLGSVEEFRERAGITTTPTPNPMQKHTAEAMKERAAKRDAAAEDGTATITITHDEESGTILEMDDKPDAATRDVLKRSGYKWSRNLGKWYKPRSRNNPANPNIVDRDASRLEEAGHTIGTSIDNTTADAATRAARKQESANERADRLEARAERKRRDADAAIAKAEGDFERLPWGGEPIKIGHHSQRRHERDIERANNSMRRSITAAEEANRAAGAALTARRTANNDESPRTTWNRVQKLRAEVRDLERRNLNEYGKAKLEHARGDLALNEQRHQDNIAAGKIIDPATAKKGDKIRDRWGDVFTITRVNKNTYSVTEDGKRAAPIDHGEARPVRKGGNGGTGATTPTTPTPTPAPDATAEANSKAASNPRSRFYNPNATPAKKRSNPLQELQEQQRRSEEALANRIAETESRSNRTNTPATRTAAADDLARTPSSIAAMSPAQFKKWDKALEGMDPSATDWYTNEVHQARYLRRGTDADQRSATATTRARNAAPKFREWTSRDGSETRQYLTNWKGMVGIRREGGTRQSPRYYYPGGESAGTMERAGAYVDQDGRVHITGVSNSDAHPDRKEDMQLALQAAVNKARGTNERPYGRVFDEGDYPATDGVPAPEKKPDTTAKVPTLDGTAGLRPTTDTTPAAPKPEKKPAARKRTTTRKAAPAPKSATTDAGLAAYLNTPRPTGDNEATTHTGTITTNTAHTTNPKKAISAGAAEPSEPLAAFHPDGHLTIGSRYAVHRTTTPVDDGNDIVTIHAKDAVKIIKAADGKPVRFDPEGPNAYRATADGKDLGVYQTVGVQMHQAYDRLVGNAREAKEAHMPLTDLRAAVADINKKTDTKTDINISTQRADNGTHTATLTAKTKTGTIVAHTIPVDGPAADTLTANVNARRLNRALKTIDNADTLTIRRNGATLLLGDGDTPPIVSAGKTLDGDTPTPRANPDDPRLLEAQTLWDRTLGQSDEQALHAPTSAIRAAIRKANDAIPKDAKGKGVVLETDGNGNIAVAGIHRDESGREHWTETTHLTGAGALRTRIVFSGTPGIRAANDVIPGSKYGTIAVQGGQFTTLNPGGVGPDIGHESISAIPDGPLGDTFSIVDARAESSRRDTLSIIRRMTAKVPEGFTVPGGAELAAMDASALSALLGRMEAAAK